MRFREDSFSKEPEQEEEERMPRNQVALFGLRLLRVPDRLRGGRDERRDSIRNALGSGLVSWCPMKCCGRGLICVIASQRNMVASYAISDEEREKKKRFWTTGGFRLRAKRWRGWHCRSIVKNFRSTNFPDPDVLAQNIFEDLEIASNNSAQSSWI
ncbi:MAG: hypothetical protein ND866_07955 [Pyrinomonadaceae bacterium]|nr:hypothetical protein [Pyrinomonadaceae bacterium]